jgi:abequosyltransferase
MTASFISQKEEQLQANQLLSIVIPTYNRAEFLDHCLKFHIPLAREHNIQLFISDNASTDNTSAISNKWKKEYTLLYYYRNESNVGPDQNFELALKYPQSKYIWLLGDTYKIPSDAIRHIIELLNAEKAEYDAIVVNALDRVVDIPQQDYSDQNKLLSDLGWHMTCMSSLVYNAKLIARANFERYRNSNFIQMGVIFEYIANRKFLIHWHKSLSVQQISIKGLNKTSWQHLTYEIWIERWANFVFSLPPSYKLDIKLKCIKDHGKKSRLLTFKSIRNHRMHNIINYKTYAKYSHFFTFSTTCSKFTILLIALTPTFFFKAFNLSWWRRKRSQLYKGQDTN